VTVAEDWRGNGLATELMSQLLRRARRDGYETIEGWVLASNAPMLALARELGFGVDGTDEAGVVRVRRKLQASPRRRRVRFPIQEYCMEAQELHRGRLIDHIQLVVRDLSASRTFYAAVLDVLHIPVAGEGDGFFWADELVV